MGHSHSTTMSRRNSKPVVTIAIKTPQPDYRSDCTDDETLVSSDTDAEKSSFSGSELDLSRLKKSFECQGYQTSASHPRLSRSSSLSYLSSKNLDIQERTLGLPSRPPNDRSTSLDTGALQFSIYPPDLIASAVSDFPTYLTRSEYGFRILVWALSQPDSDTKWIKELFLAKWYIIAIRLCQGKERKSTHSLLDLGYECAVLDRDEDGPTGELTELIADCLWLWGFILLSRGQFRGARSLWIRARISYRTCHISSALINSEFMDFSLRALDSLKVGEYARAVTYLDQVAKIAPALGMTGPAKLKLVRVLSRATLDKMFAQ